MEREAKVYWVQGSAGEKDLLIFDAGHEGGTIYIYELKESIEVKDVQKQAEEMLRYKPTIDQVVSSWIDGKFAVPKGTWKLIPT